MYTVLSCPVLSHAVPSRQALPEAAAVGTRAAAGAGARQQSKRTRGIRQFN